MALVFGRGKVAGALALRDGRTSPRPPPGRIGPWPERAPTGRGALTGPFLGDPPSARPEPWSLAGSGSPRPSGAARGQPGPPRCGRCHPGREAEPALGAARAAELCGDRRRPFAAAALQSPSRVPALVTQTALRPQVTSTAIPTAAFVEGTKLSQYPWIPAPSPAPDTDQLQLMTSE